MTSKQCRAEGSGRGDCRRDYAKGLLGGLALAVFLACPHTVRAENTNVLEGQIKALKETGGSDEWDEKVKPLMLIAYDKDGSGAIDTVEEVAHVPCRIFEVLDAAIRKGRPRGTIRVTYGFLADKKWVGDAFGFAEKMRAVADARLAECGMKPER